MHMHNINVCKCAGNLTSVIDIDQTILIILMSMARGELKGAHKERDHMMRSPDDWM
jgi:hypothetical protein